MTTEIQVSFYVLDTGSEQKSLHFTCKLVEALYDKKKNIYIHTANQLQAERLDNLLWTYREDSFLPHSLYPATEYDALAIQIGFNKPSRHHQEILINLSSTLPDFYQQFNQVIEIVFLDQVVQQLARARYKQYRDQACKLSTHKLKADEL